MIQTGRDRIAICEAFGVTFADEQLGTALNPMGRSRSRQSRRHRALIRIFRLTRSLFTRQPDVRRDVLVSAAHEPFLCALMKKQTTATVTK
jgi:hypothetical protein